MSDEKLESRIVTLSDGDEVTIWGPLDPKSIYTYVYQNKDTKELDKRFELNGKPVPKEDKRNYFLDNATGPCSLGKTEVELGMRYFVVVAKKVGNFIGFREDEIKKKGNLPFIEKSLNYKDGTRGPYLIRKEVEGHQVLFPRNLPYNIL